MSTRATLVAWSLCSWDIMLHQSKDIKHVVENVESGLHVLTEKQLASISEIVGSPHGIKCATHADLATFKAHAEL